MEEDISLMRLTSWCPRADVRGKNINSECSIIASFIAVSLQFKAGQCLSLAHQVGPWRNDEVSETEEIVAPICHWR